MSRRAATENRVECSERIWAHTDDGMMGRNCSRRAVVEALVRRTGEEAASWRPFCKQHAGPYGKTRPLS